MCFSNRRIMDGEVLGYHMVLEFGVKWRRQNKVSGAGSQVSGIEIADW